MPGIIALTSSPPKNSASCPISRGLARSARSRSASRDGVPTSDAWIRPGDAIARIPEIEWDRQSDPRRVRCGSGDSTELSTVAQSARIENASKEERTGTPLTPQSFHSDSKTDTGRKWSVLETTLLRSTLEAAPRTSQNGGDAAGLRPACGKRTARKGGLDFRKRMRPVEAYRPG